MNYLHLLPLQLQRRAMLKNHFPTSSFSAFLLALSILVLKPLSAALKAAPQGVSKFRVHLQMVFENILVHLKSVQKLGKKAFPSLPANRLFKEPCEPLGGKMQQFKSDW